MKWQPHVKKVCKTVARNVYLLAKLKPFVNSDARKLFYNAHVKSHIDYASSLWDECADVHLQTLNSLNRRAAKHILPDPTLSTDQKLQTLNILPLSNQLLFNKGIIMFKIWHKALPAYLCELFSRPTTKYPTSRLNFSVPRHRIKIYKLSLSYSGAHLWNNLPTHIKQKGTLAQFKESLFTYLMSL